MTGRAHLQGEELNERLVGSEGHCVADGAVS